MDHHDDLARIRAEFDQAKEGMREFAGSTWAFYVGLCEEGFSQQQAMELTLAWLTATARGVYRGDE